MAPDWSKRERLEQTIAGEAPDRLPVALWRHWPGDDQDAGALAAAHVQWQEQFDWDLLKVSPASSYCLVDWGVTDAWRGHVEGTREYLQRVVDAPEKWAALQPLDPTQGMLATQLEALRLLGDTFGERVPRLATIFSPLAQAKNLAGPSLALAHMRSHPEEFLAGLETVTISTLRFVEAAVANGIDGIFYAVQHARYPLLSPAEYEKFGRPFDERILEVVDDLPFNMVHLHGEVVNFDAIAGYNVPLLNWHDRDCGVSLETGLARIGGAASGGVSRDTMHTGTVEQVVDEARDAVAQTGGRRLLLGTGCVVMTNTPLANIRALRQFVENDEKPRLSAVYP